MKDVRRRAKIEALVSQLKSGQITDVQLFQELQRLRQQAAAQATGYPTEPAAPAAALSQPPATPPLPPPPPVPQSQVRAVPPAALGDNGVSRSAVVEYSEPSQERLQAEALLFQQRYPPPPVEEVGSAAPPPPPSLADKGHRRESTPQQRSTGAGRSPSPRRRNSHAHVRSSGYGQQRSQSAPRSARHPPTQYGLGGQPSTSDAGSGGVGPRGKGQSPQGPRRRVADSTPTSTRRVKPDSRYDDDECTHKPKIKALPAHYNRDLSQQAPLVARLAQWSRDREANVERRKSEQLEQELDGCTFQPQINKASRRAVEIKRFGDVRATPERMHAYYERAREAKELREETVKSSRDEAFEREHTFQPKTNTGRVYAPSRYRSAAARASTPERSASAPPARQLAGNDAKECTFKPKTNQVKKQMGAAKAYLAENVYDRLSRQAEGDAESVASVEVPMGPDRSNVMDMSEFLAAMQGHAELGQSGMGRHTANVGRSFDSVSSVRTDPAASIVGRAPTPVDTAGAGANTDTDKKKATPAQVSQFLHRQQIKAVSKEKNIKKIEKQITPSFAPTLTKKSEIIMAQRPGTSFMQRLESDTARKARQKRDAAVKADGDPDCTFKPEVTRKAQKLNARSHAAMSRDSQKRETNRRLLKFKMEQDELSQLTFKPQLETDTSTARSKIGISSDPDTYLARLQREAQAKEEKRRQILETKRSEEASQCTFVPQTKSCPASTKRIASSWKLRRKATDYDQEASERRWK